MKKLLAVCALACAMSGVAFAEEAAAPAQPAPGPTAAPSQCAAATIPADPTLPDGATANSAAMAAGNATYQAWVETLRPGYECRRTEYLQALANFRAREAEFLPWNQKRGSVTEAWQAEATEFNARPPRERR